MSKYNFDFQIETRSSKEGEKPNYIVKGYATIPDHAYAYKYFKNNVSLKEMFTKKGADNLLRKLKSKNIFVDALHERAFEHNTKELLKKIQKKTGVDISNEANGIMSQLKVSDIPLAKIHSINLDGAKPMIETRLNPMYREVDEEHRKYFDAIWYSLENGFLNKFSINFKPTDTEKELVNGEVIPKINDVDVFGISYTQDASNDMADITEVAVRSALDVDKEANRMEEENKLKKENEELKKNLATLETEKQGKLDAENKAKEEAEKKKVEDTKKSLEEREAEITKQKEELTKQKTEMETKLKEKATKPQETSVVPPESNFRGDKNTEAEDTVKKLLDVLPEIKTPTGGDRISNYAFYKNPATRPNMEGKAGFAELLTAASNMRTDSLYDKDTRRWIGRSTGELNARKRFD